MGYINYEDNEIKFLDVNSKEILLGDNIYSMETGQTLNVAWFIPGDPNYGDMLLCQLIDNPDISLPITIEQCAQYQIVENK